MATGKRSARARAMITDDVQQSRAITYARQSLDRNGDGLAVERQVQACEHLCKAKGYEIVGTAIVDNSVSASSGKDREGWSRVLDLVERKQIDVIVAWHLDRVTRTLNDLETLIDLCIDHDVALVTVQGDINLATPMGRMIARMVAAVARAEIEQKTERQVLANAQRAKAGKPYGRGKAPFGYELIDGGYAVHEPEAKHVRAAYRDLLAGKSINAIHRAWHDAGVVNRANGKPYSRSGMIEILRGACNAGLREYDGEIVGPGDWRPLVDAGTYEAALLLLNSGREFRPLVAAQTLLAGVMRCSVCGRTVRGASERSRLTYQCPRGHVSAHREIVDAEVCGAVLDRLSDRDAHRFLVQADEIAVESLAAEAIALRERRDVLAGALADGLITKANFASGAERIRVSLDAIQSQLAASRETTVLAPLVLAEDLRKVWDETPVETRRAVIDAMCTITALPTGRGRKWSMDRIRLDWRVDDEPAPVVDSGRRQPGAPRESRSLAEQQSAARKAVHEAGLVPVFD